MRSGRARVAASVVVGTVAVMASTLAVPEPAVAEAAFQARLAAGTGAMRALGDGKYGTVDVATVNSNKNLSYAETLADVQRIAARADVIGFQEGQKPGTARAYRSLTSQGWGLVHDRAGDRRSELAVAWRSDQFSYVRHSLRMMHAPNPFYFGTGRSSRARYVLEVELLHRDSGESLTVINTHANARTERHAGTRKRPGHPYRNLHAEETKRHLRRLTELITGAGSRWVVVTGDLNWGYVADQREHHPDFVEGRIDPVAVSSFKSLGLHGTSSTHPTTGRYIDYVFLARDTPAGFTGHEVVDGLNSDHRAVVATVALS